MTERNENIDSSFFNLDNYMLIPQPATCSTHGGLIIYLHKQFQYTVRDIYSPNHNWEGQFIEIFGKSITQKINLCNIYRPPRDQNNDIDIFLKDITPIIESLTREKYDLIIAGDFNINLLKLNTRNKYAEYLDVMLCNGLFPKITLPTRLADKSATLIDNIFCRVTNSSKSCTSGIIFSDISDHLPCFTCIDTQRSTQSTPRYVKTYTNDTVSMQNFYAELNG